ncbi:ArnT family glycosyltransferase [Nocardia macrotermitis]|uniref:ArnT family glycosyltransferase n=1 Tax=Nocardia macrotermitis TaxID=2585198 RepID=UPI0018861A9F|nr:glycosyltransferase family 39 protein [Nocardia macrotermitis]
MTTAAIVVSPSDAGFRWQFWRSPGDQPGWARPVLLLVAALAGVSYAWGMAGQEPQIYYAAAARSMAMNWHNFLFAAFDPDAVISVDKLPGALWVQAVSVHVFGPHVWALVLPQVVEGVLTVLLLFRVVHRTAGPVAGVVAVVVLACTPVVVSLDRGNIPDTLLILLLLLAVDRTFTAIESGRTRNLWLAGLFVGLAFQVKMVQAWVAIPLLALAYLIVATSSVRRRLADVAVFGVVALVVSLSWMTIVSLIPANRRPYVDGGGDSLFEQVFRYNALSRADSGFGVGAGSFEVGGQQNYRSQLVLGPENRLDHVFTGGGGRSGGWLVPLALIALIALVVLARHRTRNLRVVAALIIWGGWLLIHLAVFLVVGTVNPYYLAALAPPVAALIGWGAVEFAKAESVWIRRCGVLAVVATVLYGGWLLAPASPVVRWTTVAVALVLCVVAVVVRRYSIAALLIAALAAPAVAAASLIVDGYGALDMPFEPDASRRVTHDAVASALDSGPKLMTLAHNMFPSAHYPIVTYTGILAAPFIFTTGAPVPAFGGFTGSAQALTTADLARLTAQGQIGFALVTPSDDARVRWIQQYCKALPPDKNDSVRAYLCGPVRQTKPPVTHR